MKNYIEFQIHTNYEGTSTVNLEKLFDNILELKQNGICITDYNTVASYQELSKLSKKYKEIKIMYGVQISLIVSKEEYIVSLIAKNKKGIKNIYRLVTIINNSNLKPINLNCLKDFKTNLIILCNTLNNEKPINLDNIDFCNYLMLESNNKKYNEKCIKVAKLKNKKVIATNNVHYLNYNDHQAYEILNNIKSKTDLSLKSTEEMIKKFNYLNDDTINKIVIKNPNELMESIENFNIDNEDIDISNKKIDFNYIVYEKTKNLYSNNIPYIIEKRLKEELNIINKNHYENTFLLWNLIMNKCSELITCARGTVSNSLVAYILGITEVNPIIYDLPYKFFYENTLDININFPIVRDEIFSRLESDYNCYYIESKQVMGIFRANKITEDNLKDKKIKISKTERNNIINLLSNVYIGKGIKIAKSIILPKDYKILDYSPTIFKYGKDLVCITNDLPTVNILTHDMMIILNNVDEKIKEELKTINFNDKKIINLFNKLINDKDILKIEDFNLFIPEIAKKVKIEDFDDIVKLFGLSHSTGAWNEYIINCLENNYCTLKQIISTREDVYDTLIQHGFSSDEAYKVSTLIYKGKFEKSKDKEYYLKEMIKHNVPEFFIKNLKNIKYLFPKGHSISYTMNIMRLIYLKYNYPDLFIKNYIDLQEKY